MGKLITVYDDNRLLPDDPNKWPEALKQDVRNCCCGGASSPKPDPTITSPCCNGKLFPPTIFANIKNTAIHDTGMELRHFGPATVYGPGVAGSPPNIVPGWLPNECLPNPSTGLWTYPDAWYSDLYESHTCTYSNITGQGRYNTPFGFVADLFFEVSMVIKFYYYGVFGFYGANQQSLTGSSKACVLNVFELMYPAGTVKWTYAGPPPLGITNPTTTTFDWTNAYVSLGGQLSLGFYVPGAVLPYQIKTSVIQNWVGNTEPASRCIEECGEYYVKMPLSTGGVHKGLFKSCVPLIGSTSPGGFPLPAVSVMNPGSDDPYSEGNGTCEAGPYSEVMT